MDPDIAGKHLVAIKNDRISAVTNDDALKSFRKKNTRLINCKGKTVLPGFFDTHCHLHGFAETQVTLDLSPGSNIRSISDIQLAVQSLSHKLANGTWIMGKGYNEFYLDEKRHPNREDLDKVSPNHPVKITHRTGHAHVLNTLALEHVGITIETPEPRGAHIDRNIHTGEPNGILFEMGKFLSKHIPPLSEQELEKGISLVNRYLISHGITSIRDASIGNDIHQWQRLCRWKRSEQLKPRVNMMLGVNAWHTPFENEFHCSVEKKQLSIGSVKIILDEITGHLHPPQDQLNEVVRDVHQAGFQVAIHAIEERSIESACTAIEYALEKSPKQDHRHHIEHCSVCPPDLSKRLAAGHIMVVTQPPFIYYNGERYLKTVPDNQLKHLYPVKTLMENGVKVAGSSDCPVVPADPLVGIYAAVSRRTETNDPILPEESISIEKAISLYTINAAQATFEETVKGSVTPGKLADLIVLSHDPFAVPIDEIKDIQVEMTIIDGEVVWDNLNSFNQAF